MTREDALQAENARLREQLAARDAMHTPGRKGGAARKRQPVFFHERWGKCDCCFHVARYHISTTQPNARLRDQPCAKCRVPLGKGASRRARDHFKRAGRRSVIRRRATSIVVQVAAKLGMPK